MARKQDDGKPAFDGFDMPRRSRFMPSRRALLLAVPALSVSAALAGYVLETRSTNDDDDFDEPVSAGPGIAVMPSTLAGPRAKPLWSKNFKPGSDVVAVAYAAGTLIVMGDDGSLTGYDPRTGKTKWTSPLQGPPNWDAPLLTVGDILYIADINANFSAVHAADGSVLWQVRLPQPEAEVSSVYGVAGSMVFCSGDDDNSQGSGGPLLWAVDTANRRVAWTLQNVGSNLAIAGSTSAGVVVTCNEIAQHLTAYDVKDGRQLWETEAGNAGDVTAPTAAPTCITVIGNTVYWTSDRFRALDVTTGRQLWLRAAWEGDEELLGAIPQSTSVADLMIAMTVTTDTGGYLYGYLRETGEILWRKAADVEFSSRTSLVGGNGAVFVAENSNGSVYAVDSQTGQTRWTYHDPTATKGLRWPIVTNGSQLFVAYGGTIRAFIA